MEGKITGKSLKQALGADLDSLMEEVARTLNEARPGSIIADSEEGVRDAAALFRQRLYQKAVELRSKEDASAFSPSAPARTVSQDSLAEQGTPTHQLPDGQRPHCH